MEVTLSASMRRPAFAAASAWKASTRELVTKRQSRVGSSPRRICMLSRGTRTSFRALALAAALTVLPVRAGVPVTSDNHSLSSTVAEAATGGGLQHAARPGALASIGVRNVPLELDGVVDHEPLGERVARTLQKTGMSNEAIVLFVSGLPVVELRAGVPIGIALFGMRPLTVFVLAVVGNMIPIAILLPLLKLRIVQTAFAPILARARRKAVSLANSRSLFTALAVFVGVPLPGTGAFTGSLVSFVLDMPALESFLSIGAGVALSGIIMVILCELGKIGALIATAALIVFGVSSVVASISSARAHAEGNPTLDSSGALGE